MRRYFTIMLLLVTALLGGSYIVYERLTQPSPEETLRESIAINRRAMSDHQTAMKRWDEVAKQYKEDYP